MSQQDVFAVDPGPEFSAYVRWNGRTVRDHGKVNNHTLLGLLSRESAAAYVFEQVVSYGMAVGAEVFETVFWTGRFYEVAGESGEYPTFRLPRRDVKLHLCGQVRAKDINIRQALIDRFGGKAAAIGTKKAQGPLYGLKADEWQALALAVTWWDQRATSQDAISNPEGKQPC